MTKLARRLGRPATYADLEALPPTMVGEIIDGELYVFPRPRFPHAHVAANVHSDLFNPFHRGRGGPGGWWILMEPGIEIGGSPEVVPDLAGWHRERMPRPPRKESMTVVPDWICEVLSPRTRAYDLRVKRPFYARVGVPHLWYVDPAVRTLSVSRLVDGKWLEVSVLGGDDKVRVEPFEAIEIELAEWWEALGPEGEGEE